MVRKLAFLLASLNIVAIHAEANLTTHMVLNADFDGKTYHRVIHFVTELDGSGIPYVHEDDDITVGLKVVPVTQELAVCAYGIGEHVNGMLCTTSQPIVLCKLGKETYTKTQMYIDGQLVADSTMTINVEGDSIPLLHTSSPKDDEDEECMQCAYEDEDRGNGCCNAYAISDEVHISVHLTIQNADCYQNIAFEKFVHKGQSWFFQESDDFIISGEVLSIKGDRVVCDFQITRYIDNKAEIIAQPIIVCAWGEEARIAFYHQENGKDTESLILTVVASRDL
jgi:hypothetical protein